MTDCELRRAIGRAILQRRAEIQMSQASLAMLLGTSQGAVSRIERGRVPASVMLLEKVSKPLETESWLLLAHATGSPEMRAIAADLHTLVREGPGVWGTVRMLVRRPVGDTVP